jgi:hypothetical protein
MAGAVSSGFFTCGENLKDSSCGDSRPRLSAERSSAALRIFPASWLIVARS